MALLVALAAAPHARAQAPAPVVEPAGWQSCAAQPDAAQRLACYDRWADTQPAPAAAAPRSAWETAAPGTPAAAAAAAAPAVPATPTEDPTAVPAIRELETRAAQRPGCGDTGTPMQRYWELERGTGCGVFGIRIYRPLQLGLVTASSLNRAPTSENPDNVVPYQPYRITETRLQLSVRTKLAEGLLTTGGTRRDSLWFAYTQQSYWQLFTPAISRPFRSTDHEPEVIYVYPFAPQAFGGWTPRYGGVGLVHQSNGQSLPRSRSWNRVYLMAGAEHTSGASLQGRIWHRIAESAANDDNPEISRYIGRAEVTAAWARPSGHTVSLTVRNNLQDLTRGSARLEWMVPLDADDEPGRYGRLRAHVQLFTGYGDTLLDYNRRRTMLSVGLSLVDW